MLDVSRSTGKETKTTLLAASSEKKATVSDRPQRKDVTEPNAVQEQLPAWSKALGFSDQFVQAQRESTLQRWAREGPGYEVPEPALMSTSMFGGGAAFLGAILILAGKYGTDAPVDAVAIGTTIFIGGASTILGGLSNHVAGFFCKLLAPLQRKSWWGGAKVTSEVSEKELAPLLAQFDQAGPQEQAFLGMLLEKWHDYFVQGRESREEERYNAKRKAFSLRKARGELQGPAGQALRARMKVFRALPEEIRQGAERPFALYEAIFDLDGGGQLSIRNKDLPRIRSAVEALEPTELQAIAPVLSGMLFESNKAKFPMEREVLAYLTQVLAENDGGRAAQIEVHHFIFDEDNKARRLGSSEVGKLRELLDKMNPAEARACRAKIREAYFKQGRSIVKLNQGATIDLWELVSETSGDSVS